MRSLIIFSLFILVFSCNRSSDSSSSSTPSNVATVTPYLWSQYSSAKSLRISEDFSDDEVTNITDMANAWKTAVEDQKTFFTIGARTTEISNTEQTDDLYDSIFGVYKTVVWPSSLPGSALAVTQIYGMRQNAGQSNEFVDIQHADIIVNYDIHSFDTVDDGPNYDLRTVILHEMGHFIGLQHKSSTSSRSSSVMYPSISSSENKRTPTSVDSADVSEKYNISLSGGVSEALMAKERRSIYHANGNQKGEMVKIIVELHANGECVHKVNGIKTGSHTLSLKNQR
jgi:hypothetical protein